LIFYRISSIFADDETRVKRIIMQRMSILLLTVAVACTLACNGNDAKYDVSVINAPVDVTKIYLIDNLTEATIDSAVIADGVFKMKGKAAKDAYLSVWMNGNEDWYCPLFNDGKPLQINIADSTYTGSALNMKLAECDKRTAEALDALFDFEHAFVALSKEERKACEVAFFAEYQARLDAYNAAYMTTIEENLDNLIPVVYLDNVPKIADRETFDELMASGAPFTKHPYAIALKKKWEETNAETKDPRMAVIGHRFLDFEEADPDGKKHRLSEFAGQGKWVMVNFWASSNPLSEAEMPTVVSVYKKYHDKGFDIVGVSFDKEKGPWVKAIKEWDMPWIHLCEPHFGDSDVADLYSMKSIGIPDNLLIDPEGIIVARDLRGAKLESKLARIFE